MKGMKFFIVFILLSSVLFAQKKIGNKQFMLGCKNVGSSEEVAHYIEAEGTVWQYSSGSFVTGGITSDSLETVGNANFSSYDWPGFNFNWLDTQFEMPRWSLGLYKVTNSKVTSKYFFIDSRDSDYGDVEYNPDFYIYFDNSDENYYHRVTEDLIPLGEVVRVWEIKDESPKQTGLQSYWSNVLALVNKSGNPRIIWGPYPLSSPAVEEVQSYKIYRATTNNTIPPPTPNFSLLTTVSSSTLEYTDTDISIGGPLNVHYKVTCVIYDEELDETSESSASNIEVVSGGLNKSSTKFDSNLEYNLIQNYPNPFNPITTISYSLKKNAFVSLKVYDILGNEMVKLVYENQDIGEYSIPFNAVDLPSGIYFYILNTDHFSSTKKMLLVK